ncbi:MAG TPA: CDP-alcohol phosphatidyltransferase family protein [Pirellulaceae bacterium]|jgi:phosphatidylglycerophosphate synthase
MPTTSDCYSAGERAAMSWWQELRARWLAPVLTLLADTGIRPDDLTLVGLISGLAFCPLWLWSGQPIWAKIAAMTALAMHLILDGLDGPLARHLKIDSRRGSFTDTLADQIVVTATTLALMSAPGTPLNIWIGGTYIFVYALVVTFAMVRNSLGVPYSWLIRPRIWVFGWIAADALLVPGWFDVIVGAVTAVLALKMLTGFVAIRRAL